MDDVLVIDGVPYEERRYEIDPMPGESWETIAQDESSMWHMLYDLTKD